MAECLKRLCYLTSKLVNSSTCLLISPTRIYIVLCAQNYKKTSKKFKCSKFRILKGRGKPKLNPKVELSVNLHRFLISWANIQPFCVILYCPICPIYKLCAFRNALMRRYTHNL